ncbi:DinB family protein [Brevibacillus reuszeri]|uniref:DinB family protein n=1 Tax=Brevibacillus reuszeri TaxID=54915 RepID=UPI000CCBE988|nr:DinB family protein [Brevibacillus reuszeri]
MSTNREQSIRNYENTGVKIRASVEGLEEELLQWKPAPSKWSMNEIIIHLIDSNIVNSYRIRKIISEPVTSLATFAHDDWVQNQRLNDTSTEELLAVYEAITRYNSFLLQQLTEEDWQKYGLKGEEPISVSHIVDKFICNHVEIHLNQIERNKQAFSEQK